MAAEERYRPRVGDRRWFVEWCDQLAWVDDDSTSEYRQVDRDLCLYQIRTCMTREEVEAVAKEVYPQTVDRLGLVTYWEAEFTASNPEQAIRYPHIGRWVDLGEREEYHGEGA